VSGLRGLVVSVAVHAALLLLIVAVVGLTPTPALFVDLVHSLGAGSQDGGGGAPDDGAPRGAAPEKPRASAPAGRRSRPARTPSPPIDASSRPPESPGPAARSMTSPPPTDLAPDVPASAASSAPAAVVAAPSPPVAPSAPAPAGPSVSSSPMPSGADRDAGASPSGGHALRPMGDAWGSTAGDAGPALHARRGERTARPGTGESGGGGGAGFGGRAGSALTLAVPGDGGGDAAEYAGYFALLRRRLAESLVYPAAARRRGLSGTVQIEVEIESNGAIGVVLVFASSSHRLLDDAALEAVRGLGRVHFPPDVRPRRLRVRLPVVFDLR
jgi:TonB family protein